MEYLVTMTTRVPDGTPEREVDDVRAREAANTRVLAAEGYLLRLWALAGEGRNLGLWQAATAGRMREILSALPLAGWLTVEPVPLTRHPSDPGSATS